MILRAHLWHIAVPLVAPFKISSGAVSIKDTIVVELHDDAGRIGWGESSPMAGSFYSSDTPDSVWEELCSLLLPWLVTRSQMPPSRLLQELAGLPASGFARAGIDGALWDLAAQAAGVPLYRVLGCTRRGVPSGLAVGIVDSTAELIDTAARYLSEGGYQRLKIKIEPGWDVEPLARVREHFGPDLVLQTDANASYRTEHIPIFREMDRFNLAMHEQPMAKLDIAGLAELRSQITTPVCIDESAETLPLLDQALSAHACDIVNIKIQRLGGLTPALQAIDACAARGIPNWMGTMPELGIASVHAIHLAMHANMRYPTDVEASSRWFVDDIVDPLIVASGGLLHVPDQPGIGYGVRTGTIGKYTMRDLALQMSS